VVHSAVSSGQRELRQKYVRWNEVICRHLNTAAREHIVFSSKILMELQTGINSLIQFIVYLLMRVKGDSLCWQGSGPRNFYQMLSGPRKQKG